MTFKISREAISPLRARMIEDMTVRNFGAHVQSDHIRSVKKLAAFLGRSPDTATAEDLRRFQIDPVGSGATPSTVNSAVTALRFFFSTTVDQPDRTRHLALVHRCASSRSSQPVSNRATSQHQLGSTVHDGATVPTGNDRKAAFALQRWTLA